MYVPEHFSLKDEAGIRELMGRYDFALLVTAAEGVPVATHLPVLHDPAGGPWGRLHAHMARANRQWRRFEGMAEAGTEALMIFQGPHAYVSPTWYEAPHPAVPTWNYLAVHAYGVPRILAEPAEVRNLLLRLIEKHEARRPAPWRLTDQPAAFIDGMMKGIVAFEMVVTRLQAKAKLSQNKPPEQALRAAAALERDEHPLAEATAAEMRRDRRRG